MNTPESQSVATPATAPRRLLRAAGIVLARGRFLLLLGCLLALVAAWPLLQNYWDKFTRTAATGGAISSNTEYWCPMCPGVLSDWPAKCPVCNMSLVRREKGDMTPLPDGVVARVQLSPYRLQLAGIRTSPVEFLKLEHEVKVAGFLEAIPGSTNSSALTLAGDVFERDAAMLAVGQVGSVLCDACPGETLEGRISEVVPATFPAAAWRVRVQVENPRGELGPGLYAAAKFRSPVSRLDSQRRLELDRWRTRSVVGATLASLGRLDGPPAEVPLYTLFDAAVRQAAVREGYTLGVPESAVIDTGTRQVVFVESMPGMFDAVEVRLGRRCGDNYPIRSGLELGQRVATTGSILLDAETRLNPSVAASYFGAGSRIPSASLQQPAAPASPSPDDRQIIARQKTCPVGGGELDSMGGPVKLVVNGRVVFICCEGCEKPLRKNPELYLSKIPK